jgi:hypothetical protein
VPVRVASNSNSNDSLPANVLSSLFIQSLIQTTVQKTTHIAPVVYKYALLTESITKTLLLVKLFHSKKNFHHKKLYVTAEQMRLIWL